jgi:hypothetical protein
VEIEHLPTNLEWFLSLKTAEAYRIVQENSWLSMKSTQAVKDKSKNAVKPGIIRDHGVLVWLIL